MHKVVERRKGKMSTPESTWSRRKLDKAANLEIK